MSDSDATGDAPAAPLTLIDADRYPLHRPDSAEYTALVEHCRAQLAQEGTYDLVGFLRPEAVERAVDQMRPLIDHDSFLHRRSHNVWFLPAESVEGVAADHPSLAEMHTSNRTVCADQMAGTVVLAVYEWAPLRAFIAATVGVPRSAPDGRPARPRERHVVSRGRGPQLALRSGPVHQHVAVATTRSRRRVRIPTGPEIGRSRRSRRHRKQWSAVPTRRCSDATSSRAP